MQWIRFRTDLRTDARMTSVAVFLVGHGEFGEWLVPGHGRPTEIMPFDAVVSVAMAGVLRVWGEVCNSGERIGASRSGDAMLRMIRTPIQIDQMAGFPGCAEAMESVGWLAWDDDSHAVFPGFLRHNNLKPKSGGSVDRVRRWREKNVTPDVTPKALHVTPDVTHVTPDVTRCNASFRTNVTRKRSISVSESTSGLSPGEGVGGGGDSAPPGPPTRTSMAEIEAAGRDPDAAEANAFFGAGGEDLPGESDTRVDPQSDLGRVFTAIFGRPWCHRFRAEHLDRMVQATSAETVIAFVAPRWNAPGARRPQWRSVVAAFWSEHSMVEKTNGTGRTAGSGESTAAGKSGRAADRRAAERRREFAEDDAPIPVNRV